jgi:hypothetical protein
VLVADCGAVFLSGFDAALWARLSSGATSPQIAAPNTMAILKFFFIDICPPRRLASAV